MKKFKINVKLTAFLVSLFVSLVMVIWGSKNKYCLSFGLMLLGVSLSLFAVYYKEKLQEQIKSIAEDINNLDEIDDDIETNEEMENEERLYVLKELCIAQRKLKKKRKQSIILFNICGFALAILGLINLF